MQSDGRPSDSDVSGSSSRAIRLPANGQPVHDRWENGSRVVGLVGAVTALIVGCFSAILFHHSMAELSNRELVSTASVLATNLENAAGHRREQLLTFRDSHALYNFLNSSAGDDSETLQNAKLNTIRSVSQAMNMAGDFDTVSIADRDGRLVLSTGIRLSDRIKIPDAATTSPELELVSRPSENGTGENEVVLRWIAPVSRSDGTLLGAVVGETNSQSLQTPFAFQNQSIPVQTWVLIRQADQWLTPTRSAPDNGSPRPGTTEDNFPVAVLDGQESTTLMIPKDGDDQLVVWESVELAPFDSPPCRIVIAADPSVAYASVNRVVNLLGLVTLIAVSILIALTVFSPTLFAPPATQISSPNLSEAALPLISEQGKSRQNLREKSQDDADQLSRPKPTSPADNNSDPSSDSRGSVSTVEDDSAEIQTSSLQLDWSRVLKSMGGNPDMLREIALAMQAECPQCMTQIDRAIETNDESLLRRSAHTIKGSLRLFGPSVAQNVATEIETHCKAGDLDKAKRRVPKLRREIDGFLTELNQFLRDFDSIQIKPVAESDESDSDLSWDRPAPVSKKPVREDASRSRQTALAQNRLPDTSSQQGQASNAAPPRIPPPVSPESNGKGRLTVNAEPGEFFSVLIIEDSDVDAMVVDQRLKSDGRFQATRAATLQQGCRYLQENSAPDALILDLNLPDSAGLNTFKTIHQQFPSQPVVVLTGEKDEAQAMEAMREGAQDYVYKSSLDETVLIRALLYAIERNKRRVAEQRQRDVESELELAKQIQQHLLPQNAPSIQGFDVAGRCVSADATSGDLFDFIDHGDGKWDIVLADVCGHGLGPAMITVGARRLLRSSATLNEDVGSLLTIANRGICDDLFGSLFVALFFARLDSEARRLTYVGAGQPAFLIDAEGSGSMLASSGIPTGIEAEFEYTTDGEVDLSGDKILLLMTDGVWEAHEDALDPFGKERAFDIVHENRDRSSDEIVGALIEAVKAHCKPGHPKDDITVVVLKPNPMPAS